MPQAKHNPKQSRRSKPLPVLGAAGLSLSLASTASAVPGGPAVNLPNPGNGDGNQVILGEEEIADVSLAAFYVFDKEGLGASPPIRGVLNLGRDALGLGRSNAPDWSLAGRTRHYNRGE